MRIFSLSSLLLRSLIDSAVRGFASGVLRLTVIAFLSIGSSVATSEVGSCSVVLSYYWPVSSDQAGVRPGWMMRTPNLVDLISAEKHGTDEERKAWREQGGLIASRVHPFRYSRSKIKNVDYFLDSIGRDAVLSIDELVADGWPEWARKSFLSILSKVKSERPGVKILLWDATDWKIAPLAYLDKILDMVDYVVLERYLTSGNIEEDIYIKEIASTLKFVETHPGLEERALLAIGVNKKKMRSSQFSSREALKQRKNEVKERLVAAINLISKAKVKGIGIYAPLYLPRSTLEVMDSELRKFNGCKSLRM